MTRRIRFAGADIIPIAALGIGQFGVLIALLNYGLRTVPAARGALIFASFPLLTLVVAALLGHERVTARKTAGILATLLGVFLALSDKVLDSSSVHGWSALGGELAILASAAVGAICSVLYRPYLARYPTLPVSAFAMMAAALALLTPRRSTICSSRRQSFRAAPGPRSCSSAFRPAAAMCCGYGR